MSNEHTESNPNKNRRKRNRRPRTMRWFHESNVGPDHGFANTVAKFFISTSGNPEIFLVLMNREDVIREDGTVGLKPIYAGDIERNAVPISMIDLDQLYNALVTMKSRLERMKDSYTARGSRTAVEAGVAIEKAVLEVFNEKPLQPKRSQQPVQPLTHRMAIPPKLVTGVQQHAPAPPEPTQQPSSSPVVDLASMLPGW